MTSVNRSPAGLHSYPHVFWAHCCVKRCYTRRAFRQRSERAMSSKRLYQIIIAIGFALLAYGAWSSLYQ